MNKTDDSDKLPVVGEEVPSKHSVYKVGKLLGKGGFGAVFDVTNPKEEHFAMKCEVMGNKMAVLMMDCKVLQGAASIQSPHFCRVLDRGRKTDCFKFLIMTLVGHNLWDLRLACRRMRFSMNTSLKCMEQCLMSIEDLHHVGFLHRDIKPGNFCAGIEGTKDAHVIYLLDFGLCRKFVGESEDKDIRMPRDTAPFRGTTRYASIAALSQTEQSRKDDIETLMYVVVEWTCGSLPWRHLGSKDKAEVLAMKKALRDDKEALADFLGICPKREFIKIFQHVYALNYTNIPDYYYIYFCLKHAMKVKNIEPYEPLDWDPHTPYHGPTLEDRRKRIDLVPKE